MINKINKFKYKIHTLFIVFSFSLFSKAQALVTAEVLSRLAIFESGEYNNTPTPDYDDWNLTSIDGLKNATINSGKYTWDQTKKTFSPSRRWTDTKNIGKALFIDAVEMTEAMAVTTAKAYSKHYTISYFDKLKSKLPKRIQDKYNQITSKIDEAILKLLEKFKGESKKPEDQTLMDRTKEFLLKKGSSYLKSALYIFCVQSIKFYFTYYATIQSIENDSKMNPKDKADRIKNIKLSFNNCLGEIAKKSIESQFSISSNPLIAITNLKELADEIKEEIFTTKMSEEEKIEQTINFLELINPEKAVHLKKQYEEYKKIKPELDKKRNSPLRKIGEFVLDVLFGTVISEAQDKTANLINEKILGNDEDSIKTFIKNNAADSTKINNRLKKLSTQFLKKMYHDIDSRDVIFNHITQGYEQGRKVNANILKELLSVELNILNNDNLVNLKTDLKNNINVANIDQNDLTRANGIIKAINTNSEKVVLSKEANKLMDILKKDHQYDKTELEKEFKEGLKFKEFKNIRTLKNIMVQIDNEGKQKYTPKQISDAFAHLGLTKDATKEEVASKYRKLCRENHSDKKPGNANADTRFKEIQDANNILKAHFEQKSNGIFGKLWNSIFG